MKKTMSIILGTLLVVSTLFFSCEKEKNIEATLITDCTGTYLRINEKDYKVCNLKVTEGFVQEQKVEVTVKKKEDCNGSGNFSVVCQLHHPFESWVHVYKIE